MVDIQIIAQRKATSKIHPASPGNSTPARLFFLYILYRGIIPILYVRQFSLIRRDPPINIIKEI